MELSINGKVQPIQSDPATPLLWVLRDELNLVGTKFGCGVRACGACTVLVDGAAQRSCLLPVSAVEGKKITTIEGLSPDRSHALQKAWIKHQVPQCGYCQSGFLMAASALLAANPRPTTEQINKSLSNICRCGTYDAMRAAIQDVVEGTV
ncbi:MAG: (2Fe-2S)-binding protein [Betaproteobacteria bacterium]